MPSHSIQNNLVKKGFANLDANSIVRKLVAGLKLGTRIYIQLFEKSPSQQGLLATL